MPAPESERPLLACPNCGSAAHLYEDVQVDAWRSIKRAYRDDTGAVALDYNREREIDWNGVEHIIFGCSNCDYKFQERDLVPMPREGTEPPIPVAPSQEKLDA